MLQLQEISHSFGSLKVLENVSLNIPSQQVTTLVGPSGAGKSTLLHIAGTLLIPQNGNVMWDGVPVEGMKEKELAKWRNESIGFVFQFHHLLGELTALENVILPGLIGNRPTEELKKRGLELLEKVGLSNRVSHLPGQLSGGEQQRVAVARALINRPKMILADEPSGNLDTRNAESLHQLFFDLAEYEQQGFLIVTHNEELAKRSHRNIELRDGRVFGG
jgi:lipoprotein-releasing system ATP-binding protein